MRETRYLPIVAILLLAAFLRAWISDFTLILLDYDAFYHARIADEIYQNHHIPIWDAKELGGIPHYYPPVYHVLIVLGKYFFPGWSFLAIGSILTVFFGVVTTLFVYLIGRRLGKTVGLLSALLYAVTPMAVLRQGLWARPTGISMMFALLLFYLFLRVRKGNKYAALALFAALGYTFTHSSVILVLALILVISVLAKDIYKSKTFLKIALVALSAASLYYYMALPYLNFSVSQKGEYMPVTGPILELLPFGGWAPLAAALLFLGLFNLAFFPFVFHGIYEMVKWKKMLGMLAIFSFLTAFLWANMFMLLNFTVCIAIAASLVRISRISIPPAAALILLAVIGMDAALLTTTQGEKKHQNADIVKEILQDAPLTAENLVLASDPNIGHAIPYYSPANTFISDLTDTKQYNKNRETFDRIMNEGTPADEAAALLKENNIDHLLVIGERFHFIKGSDENFLLVRETEKNGVKAKLYRLKE